MKQLADLSDSQTITIEEFHKNKYSFIVALLAVILALVAFKEGLRAINVDFLFVHSDLYRMSLPFVGVLGLSAYLFAMSLLSGGFYQKFGRFFGRVADGFYVLGMVYPLAIGLTWGAVTLLGLIDFPEDVQTLLGSTMALIVGIAGAVFTLTQERRLNRQARYDVIAIKIHLAEKFDEYIGNDYDRQAWGSMLVAANVVMKTSLEGLLMLEGSSPSNDLKKLVAQAVEKGLITQKQAAVIQASYHAESAKDHTRSIAERARLAAKDLFEQFLSSYPSH